MEAEFRLTVEVAMQEVEDDLDLLLDLASEYEAPFDSPYMWRSNAHDGLLDLLQKAIAINNKVHSEGDVRAFGASFITVCSLIEEAIDALLDYPDTNDALYFVETTHPLIADMVQKIDQYPPDLLDKEKCKEYIQSLYNTLQMLRHQLH